MSISKKNVKTQFGIFKQILFWQCSEMQLTALFHREDVLFQKRCLFTLVRICRPLPVVFIAPEAGIFKGGFKARSILIPLNTTTTMVKMQMRHKDVGDVLFLEPQLL